MKKTELKNLCTELGKNHKKDAPITKEYTMKIIKRYTNNDLWSLNLLLEEATSESVSNFLSNLLNAMALLVANFSFYITIFGNLHTETKLISILIILLLIYDALGIILLFEKSPIIKWKKYVVVAIKEIIANNANNETNHHRALYNIGNVQQGGHIMKFISWNVNGLRACVQKGFLDFFHTIDADFFCIQESKLQEGQIDLDLPGYHQYWNYAEKKGYSGTAIFAKKEPISVAYGIGIEEHDKEGRVITLEYENFYLVTCYTPNSQNELARLPYRMQWEDDFRAYLQKLDESKPVILCGDLNVAHEEIDLKNPKTNRKNAGFSDEERAKMTELLGAGFTDTFRFFYPDTEGIYSWWSYRFKAREKNAGWRIDYFITSKRLDEKLEKAAIHTDIFGSDHCPVEVDITL